MKKSFILTLALVFVLKITTTTFANPFTDVAANHWAYDSLTKLARAGIIDGYGDGRYIGSSNMTRYEMAQIVAKAMVNSDKADNATKAQIEKLVSEFSTELNKLGIKVANLEKKTDNVKITGEVRFANHAYSDVSRPTGENIPNHMTGENLASLRTRLWLTGNVNDNWKYTTMIENIQYLKTNNQETETAFRRAWVEGKIGAIGVTAGRFNYLSLYSTVLDDASDGLVLNYTNKKLSLDAFALRPMTINLFLYEAQDNVQTYGAQLNYNFDSKWHIGATYYDLKGKSGDGLSPRNLAKINTSIFEIGLDYKFDKNWFAWAQYIKGGQPVNIDDLHVFGMQLGPKNGWAAGMSFGRADRNKPSSYQLRAGYYNVPELGSISTTLEYWNFADLGFGFKGYMLGGTYTLVENIDINFDYYSFKTNRTFDNERYKGNLLFSYVRFYF